MSKPAKATVAIQVIERMFSLLDAMAAHPDPQSLKALSTACHLHPSTAHRILNDLAVGGYVVRHGAGMYKLGPRLMTLGELVQSRLSVRQVGAEVLKEWHAQHLLPASLWLLEDGALTLGAQVFSRKKSSPLPEPSPGQALHASTAGLMLLKGGGGAEVEAYARRLGLARVAPSEPMDAERLQRRLAQLDLDEVVAEPAGPGQVTLNAAVWDHRHHLAGVVSVLAPAPAADRVDAVARVKSLARDFSVRLGDMPPSEPAPQAHPIAEADNDLRM